GAMIGPALPTSAEMKLETPPTTTKPRGDLAGVSGRGRHRRQATAPSKNAPSNRLSSPKGAVANRNPPSKPDGAAPMAYQPTTAQRIDRQLNQTRAPFPAICATVITAIASRGPKTQTSGGNKSA